MGKAGKTSPQFSFRICKVLNLTLSFSPFHINLLIVLWQSCNSLPGIWISAIWKKFILGNPVNSILTNHSQENFKLFHLSRLILFLLIICLKYVFTATFHVRSWIFHESFIILQPISSPTPHFLLRNYLPCCYLCFLSIDFVSRKTIWLLSSTFIWIFVIW